MPSTTARSTREHKLAFDRPVNRHWQSDRKAIGRHGPIIAGFEGLPVGTGAMGTLVWTSEHAICMNINRNDVYPMNASTTSFFERNTDYCGPCGQVEVHLPAGPGGAAAFPEDAFTRELSIDTGLVRLESPGVVAEVVAMTDRDVIAVRVTDRRTGADGPLQVKLRMNREPVKRFFDHVAESSFVDADGDLGLRQQFTEHEHYCQSLMLARCVGGGARIVELDERTSAVQMPAGGEATVLISAAASFDREAVLRPGIQSDLAIAEQLGFEGVALATAAWWGEFWRRNPMRLHSADGVADRVELMYHYWLYNMASTSRGTYPPKFNALLWAYHGDVRPWGAQHWWHNLSCMYRGLHATGDPQLTDPMYDMYWNMFERCRIAAEQVWDSKGVFYPEITPFDGLDPLPGDIAEEMHELYLYRKPWPPSERFMKFAWPRNPRETRWNWKWAGQWVGDRFEYEIQDIAPASAVVHLLSSNARIAWQFWMRYAHTLDERFLSERAYPVIRGVAEFFRTFPNVKLGDDGRYHIHRTNVWEHRLDATDGIDCVASMHASTALAIAVSKMLDVDAGLRAQWEDFQRKLPDYPTAEDEYGRHWVHAANHTDKCAHNTMMPVSYWPDLVNPETRDVELLATARRTLDRAWSQESRKRDGRVDALDGRSVATAVLGGGEDMKWLLPDLVRADFLHCNGLSPRESSGVAPGATVQCHGVMSQCLQIALCASLAPAPGEPAVIRPFHAWPADWDAEFELHARDGFIVRGAWQDGAPRWFEVESTAGRMLNLRWPKACPVHGLARNGEPIDVPTDDPWRMPTKPGDVLRVQCAADAAK